MSPKVIMSGSGWAFPAYRPVSDIAGTMLVTDRADGGPQMSDHELAEESHRTSEARFRALVNASADTVYRMSPDWSEMRQLDGRGLIADTAEPRRNWIEAYVHPDDRLKVRVAIQDAIRNRTTFELQHRVSRADGAVGWTLSRAAPVIDHDGEIVEWIGVAIDLTERHRIEDDLARVTADSDKQRRLYESLISATPDLVYAFDSDYRFIFANQALLEMWGRTYEESIGKRLIEVGYEPWHADMHEREIDRVIATRAGIRGEVGFPHATLGRRIYDYIFMPVFNAEGEVVSIAGTTRDITDIKRAEEHLHLLVNELNHRVKNTLATVQSLARQSFRDDAVASKRAFEQRLVALSNAHTLLTRTNWEKADLGELVAQALLPFKDNGTHADRFRIGGEAVILTPQTALALAMALHELASNAVKYGALSNDEGHVAIGWERDGDRLRIVWREMAGPAVVPPGRKGFGSRLLERGLASELNGAVRLEYPSSGVVCTIELPLGGGA